jgi:hypothetical protein
LQSQPIPHDIEPTDDEIEYIGWLYGSNYDKAIAIVKRFNLHQSAINHVADILNCIPDKPSSEHVEQHQ